MVPEGNPTIRSGLYAVVGGCGGVILKVQVGHRWPQGGVRVLQGTAEGLGRLYEVSETWRTLQKHGFLRRRHLSDCPGCSPGPYLHWRCPRSPALVRSKRKRDEANGCSASRRFLRPRDACETLTRAADRKPNARNSWLGDSGSQRPRIVTSSYLPISLSPYLPSSLAP